MFNTPYHVKQVMRKREQLQTGNLESYLGLYCFAILTSVV